MTSNDRHSSLDRRRFLLAAGAGGAVLATGGKAFAQEKTLNTLSHLVHQNVLTKGAAGDVIAPWREAQKAEDRLDDARQQSAAGSSVSRSEPVLDGLQCRLCHR